MYWLTPPGLGEIETNARTSSFSPPNLSPSSFFNALSKAFSKPSPCPLTSFGKTLPNDAVFGVSMPLLLASRIEMTLHLQRLQTRDSRAVALPFVQLDSRRRCGRGVLGAAL